MNFVFFIDLLDFLFHREDGNNNKCPIPLLLSIFIFYLPARIESLNEQMKHAPISCTQQDSCTHCKELFSLHTERASFQHKVQQQKFWPGFDYGKIPTPYKPYNQAKSHKKFGRKIEREGKLVEPDGRPPFLATVTKCFLMGEMLGLCK